MIVLKSKYEELEAKYMTALLELQRCKSDLNSVSSSYSKLTRSWNDLVQQINDKGGKQFLDEAVIPSRINSNLTQDDIKRLLQLCHPDKHGGKQIASEMTVKLLSMRK